MKPWRVPCKNNPAFPQFEVAPGWAFCTNRQNYGAGQGKSFPIVLFGFPMQRMFPAHRAIFFQFQTVRIVPFVFFCRVIARFGFTLGTGEMYNNPHAFFRHDK